MLNLLTCCSWCCEIPMFKWKCEVKREHGCILSLNNYFSSVSLFYEVGGVLQKCSASWEMSQKQPHHSKRLVVTTIIHFWNFCAPNLYNIPCLHYYTYLKKYLRSEWHVSNENHNGWHTSNKKNLSF